MTLPKRKQFIIVFICLFLIFFSFLFIYRTGIFFDLTYKLPLTPLDPQTVRENAAIVALDKSACDQSIWQHVYSPNRLFMIYPCIEVKGVIEKKIRVSDGDNHISFKPDSKYPSLVNLFNEILANSDIIAEPVCLGGNNNDPDAIKACQGYQNKIMVPKEGTHIKMYGSLVLDKSVGWIEIHPVTKIEVLD